MAFNQPLSLDTSSLTNMHSMFKQTEAFNQPLHFSDTSRVEIMKEMFKVLGTSPLCTHCLGHPHPISHLPTRILAPLRMAPVPLGSKRQRLTSR